MFLMAQTQGGEGANPMVSMGLILLMFVVFYIFIIMPQNKKQKQLKKILSKLTRGDKVLTTGGIIGTVVSQREDIVVIKIADNTKVEINKGYIVDKVTDKIVTG